MSIITTKIKEYLKKDYLEHKDIVIENRVFSRDEIKHSINLLEKNDHAFIQYYINPNRLIFNSSFWNEKIKSMRYEKRHMKYKYINRAVKNMYQILLENSALKVA